MRSTSRGCAVAEADARIDDALAEVGLRPLAHRSARVLSGGEQQRLALARAWALRPEVLFLDEPTASLDPKASRAVEEIVRGIHARGTTIVMTTHNLAQAKRLASRRGVPAGGPAGRAVAGTRLFQRAADVRGGGFPRRRTIVMRRQLLAALAGLLFVLGAPATGAQEKFIVVSSTTSTEQSGLFAHLLPLFEKDTGIKVRVVALGTGQALDMARRGDADVVFVHDQAAEEKFVAEGFGVRRLPVMYNDFVLVGPKSDPAKIAGGKDILVALQKIAAAQAPFVSRGDKSGTHAAELRYWKAAGVDLDAKKGAWYKDTGSGMGPTLNTASSMNGYVLTDRGTWLSFRNRGDLAILVEGDQKLFNQYGVMLVNPAKHPHVKKDLGQQFVDWVVSPQGQAAIAGYKIGGEQLFFPNARG